VWMLPALAANMLSFQVSPLLARRFRPAPLITCGLTVSVTGLLILTQVGTAQAPQLLVAGWALLGLGAGPLVTLGTDLIIGSVPQRRAGAAAAINETSGELGFALGIAIMGSLGTALYRARIDVPAALTSNATPGAAAHAAGPGAADAARESLAGAVAVAESLPGPVRDALLDSSRAAYTSGLHAVALVSAVVMAGVAVLIAVMLRRVPRIGANGAAETREPEPHPVAALD
jgi:MFS transporter, DHA2 family, multidrug resistance protein